MNGAIRRGYNHWWFAIDTLPPYMKKNLQEMPNNKGYRWKGVTFYGYLPEIKDQSTIIFEKVQGELIIHEHAIDGTYSKTIKQKSSNKDIANKVSQKTHDDKKNRDRKIDPNDKKKQSNDKRKIKKQTVEKTLNDEKLLKNDQNSEKKHGKEHNKQDSSNIKHKVRLKKRLLVNKS